MQSTRARAGIGIALIAIAVILFIVLGGGGSGDSKSVTEGTPDDRRQERQAGRRHPGVSRTTRETRSTSSVNSDVSDEIHVHGYDLMKDVKAGGTGEL